MGVAGKRRGPVAVWLLSLITLGIYGLVWWYKINEELGRFDGRIEVNPTNSVLAIFPGAFLCYVPPIITLVKGTDRIRRAQQSAGLPGTANPGLTILFLLVFGLYPAYLQVELNRVWDRYGAPEGAPVQLYA